MKCDCLWGNRRKGLIVLGIVALVLGVLAPTAMAAPQRLANYDFVVSGQNGDTGLFALPSGMNRTIIVTVHARTDSGTSDYVTVDYARLDNEPAQPFAIARQRTRSFAANSWQGVTMLYRHIDNALSGNVSVRVRMNGAATEDKLVQVMVLGNIDSTHNPVDGDANGAALSASGTSMSVTLSADVDFAVVDATVHNAFAGSLTGRFPGAKFSTNIGNSTPAMRAMLGFYVRPSSGSSVYSYTINTSDSWCMVAVRFRAAYTITASAGANGAIVPAGDVSVTSGANSAFTVTADENYVIAQVLADGVPVSAAAGEESYVYTFNNVTANHTIAASFSGKPIITVDPAEVNVECAPGGYTALMAMDGVSANDPEDGIITGDVVMSNVSFPITVPGEYLIYYDVVDGEGVPAVQKQRVVLIDDTEAPDLALNGSDVVLLECNLEFYEEQGASALDACEGDLSGDIDIAGGDSVNTAVLGPYVVAYSVEDSMGNAAYLERQIEVVDTTPPVVTLLGPAPYIIDGGGVYVEEGAVAWDACDGDRSAFIAIDESGVNTSALGSYYVTYTVADGLGNEEIAERQVIVQREECALLIDMTADPNPAAPGDIITFRAIEQAGSCKVGALHYQWKKLAEEKAGFVVIPTAPDSPTFVLSSSTVGDTGTYMCTVSDDMYSVDSPEVQLIVGTGVPVATGLGMMLAAAASALVGAGALRKRR